MTSQAIIAVMGLPGSGKSFFAHHLADSIGAAYLSSDRIRKELSEQPGYSPQQKEKVYQELFERAAQQLNFEKTVVLDATFHLKSRRTALAKLAWKKGVSLCWIEIIADEGIIRHRLSKERLHSDADYSVYRKIRRELESLEEPHLTLESGHDNIDDMLEASLEYLNDD